MSRALAAWDVVRQGPRRVFGRGATVVQHDRFRWFATGARHEGLNGGFVRPGTPAVPVEDVSRTFQRLGVPRAVAHRLGFRPVGRVRRYVWTRPMPEMRP